jgi:CBS domain-containing protein
MSTEAPTYPNLARLTVRDAMQLGLFECGRDADITSLARTMAERTIHCVVVSGLDRDDQAWGIVSDLDLMRALAPGAQDATAGELAATDLVAVRPADTLERAAQLMAEHDTAHLVVASPDTGRPVGMVSTLDVARAVAFR